MENVPCFWNSVFFWVWPPRMPVTTRIITFLGSGIPKKTCISQWNPGKGATPKVLINYDNLQVYDILGKLSRSRLQESVEFFPQLDTSETWPSVTLRHSPTLIKKAVPRKKCLKILWSFTSAFLWTSYCTLYLIFL